MTTTTVKLNLVEMTCGECGIVFAVPEHFKKECLRTHQGWFCPNGHSRVFTGESVEEKAKRLEKELLNSKESKDWYQKQWLDERGEHQDTKNSLRATKAAKTRLKNRIKNGVCPCCQRHFTNLQRHIETKHPEYNE